MRPPGSNSLLGPSSLFFLFLLSTLLLRSFNHLRWRNNASIFTPCFGSRLNTNSTGILGNRFKKVPRTGTRVPIRGSVGVLAKATFSDLTCGISLFNGVMTDFDKYGYLEKTVENPELKKEKQTANGGDRTVKSEERGRSRSSTHKDSEKDDDVDHHFKLSESGDGSRDYDRQKERSSSRHRSRSRDGDKEKDKLRSSWANRDRIGRVKGRKSAPSEAKVDLKGIEVIWMAETERQAVTGNMEMEKEAGIRITETEKGQGTQRNHIEKTDIVERSSDGLSGNWARHWNLRSWVSKVSPFWSASESIHCNTGGVECLM